MPHATGPTKAQENRDLNEMYKAYTGDRQPEAGNPEENDDSDEEDEEVKDFQDKTTNQKYDIKKQIS